MLAQQQLQQAAFPAVSPLSRGTTEGGHGSRSTVSGSDGESSFKARDASFLLGDVPMEQGTRMAFGETRGRRRREVARPRH